MKGRVIGMVQTRPLPGSYRNRGERISFITEQALEETRILAECGVQSVILQNMGDMPIRQQSTPEAIAYLSVVAQAIRRSFPALCLGVLVNWDGVAALAVADAAGADFVRVEHLYTGAEVTSAGLLQGQCCEITALKRKLGTDIPVYADVWERHGIPLCPCRWTKRPGSASTRRLPTVCSSAGRTRRRVCPWPGRYGSAFPASRCSSAEAQRETTFASCCRNMTPSA